MIPLLAAFALVVVEITAPAACLRVYSDTRPILTVPVSTACALPCRMGLAVTIAPDDPIHVTALSAEGLESAPSGTIRYTGNAFAGPLRDLVILQRYAFHLKRTLSEGPGACSPERQRSGSNGTR